MAPASGSNVYEATSLPSEISLQQKKQLSSSERLRLLASHPAAQKFHTSESTVQAHVCLWLFTAFGFCLTFFSS